MAVQNYDVVTIGGGIGAASLAKAMAEHGAAVLILEKEQRFKDRVRGEGSFRGVWPRHANLESLAHAPFHKWNVVTTSRP